LTSHEALELSANFALSAERMRSAGAGFHLRARLSETASRIAFLRAHLLAKSEEACPAFGQLFKRAAFTVA
jgi:hypothetical protein